MKPIGVGVIGASPGAGCAEGTTVAPSFSNAVRLHRLVDRIAGGTSAAGVKMTPESEETPCAQPS